MTFPLWMLWALAGHLANGAAFVLDKTLLRKSFRHPATYAGLIGVMGVLAGVLIPFGITNPDPMGWFWIVASGMTFIFSLWIFFAALASGEASRVVPIIGSLIPVLTLVGTSVCLGERLTQTQLAGFTLLIIATIILSGGSTRSRLTARTIWLAIFAAFVFAVSSVMAKISYDGYGFLTTFTISRLAGVLAAAIILFLDAGAAHELRTALIGNGRQKQTRLPAGKTGGARSAVVLVILAQVLGSLGFVGVQYATSLGSAALVNALQAVQYVLLVAVAFALRTKAPDLLGEDLTTSTVIRKSSAIIIVGIGLWLVV